ncbi:MAG: putative Ig domain-containing protein [Syntrophaceae bacterium]|nr:putative Ig domain-containing protein [Syntrophaceae bacterium]
MITKKNDELLKKGGSIMLKKFALCILFIVIVPGTTIAQDQWISIPSVGTQLVHCIAVDPSNSNIMYAGTQENGIYKSTDGGVSWFRPIQKTQPFTWVDKILINPENLLYAAGYGGFAISRDGGYSWLGTFSKFTHAITIDPVEPNIIYIGTTGGVYKSLDGGMNFSWSGSGVSGIVTELLIDPHNRNILYAGTESFCIFKSMNAGGSWTPIYLPPSYCPYINALDIDPVNNILYVGTDQGLFKSTDEGATWSQNISYTSDVRSFLINPGNPDVLYVGTYNHGVFKSTNRGANWSAMNNGLPTNKEVHTLVPNLYNHFLFAGTFGGMYKSFLGNLPPNANAGPDQTVKATSSAGASVTLNGSGSWDPDGDPLTFNWSGPFGTATGMNPTVILPTGNNTITLTVTDTLGATGTDTVVVTVVPNNSPVLDPIGNKQVNEGQLLQFTITASDPDGDALTYEASNLPTGATFDGTARTFQWTPGYDQAGSYQNVLFRVTDSGTPPLSASEAITITVGNVNRPPVLDPIGNKQVNEGQLLQFTITASDPDGDALTYEASNLPTGAIFDPVSQKFSWIPTYDQGVKSYTDIEFTVTDNGSPNELDFELIKITVGNVNRAPVFSPVGTQGIHENQLLQFNVTATDPDGDAITYSTGPLPKGAFFDASGGLFSWTPDSTQAGIYTVAFYAMDSGSPPMTGNLNVSINVGEVYTPCELADQIIQIVISLNLPKSVENSYMANLKKVCKFVEEGQTTPAINQLEAFINKVRTDITKGNISEVAGNNLINMATQLISILRS